MGMQRIGSRIRGFYRVAGLGHLWEMTRKGAPRRLDNLRFFHKHGLGERNPAAPHAPPQPGQSQAPRVACPLVRPARYPASQRLDDRAHHQPHKMRHTPCRIHRRAEPSPCGGRPSPENPSR